MPRKILKACPGNVKYKSVATPFLEEASAIEDQEVDRGTLADHACGILMKVLYAARVARFDLLRAVNSLASKVTKWTTFCDHMLHRLMCYIKSTLSYRMRSEVLKTAKLNETTTLTLQVTSKRPAVQVACLCVSPVLGSSLP